jgi:DUF1707 SHOCT-like domain
VGGRLDVRLSDAERHLVVQRLNDGFADGRLTLDELHERLDAVYHAATRGDVVAITADLPRHRSARRRDTRRLRVPWTFLEVNAVLWGIWGAQELFSSGSTDLWPLIVSVPWGALIIVQRARPTRSATHR